ncbi:MAG: hypothetical protein WCD13_18285 [Pseudolabrys sp.]
MSIQISFEKTVGSIVTAQEHLHFVTVKDADFRSCWLEFLRLLPMFGFCQHPAVFEYYQMLSAPDSLNLTFLIRNDEGIPIALVPLLVERINGRMYASLRGGFLPHPIFHPHLSAKQLRALENFCFEVIIKQLKASGVVRWYAEADIFQTGTDALEDQMLARFEGLDVSIQCHVMDLTASDEDLWQQIRHSIKRNINRGLKVYEFRVYDKTNFTFEIGEKHRLLHHKCSGRITRPIPTFHKMYSWIQEDCGLMFEQLHNGETVLMAFVAVGKHAAFGASAADDPDFKWEIPMMHSMTYFILKECQRRGIKYFDIGETSYRDTLFNIRTDKEKTICDFKRGFGRQTMPCKRWIWFSSAEEELAFFEEQFSKYKSTHLTKRTAQNFVSLDEGEYEYSSVRVWIDGEFEPVKVVR